jgi:hypothetical protein
MVYRPHTTHTNRSVSNKNRYKRLDRFHPTWQQLVYMFILVSVGIYSAYGACNQHVEFERSHEDHMVTIREEGMVVVKPSAFPLFDVRFAIGTPSKLNISRRELNDMVRFRIAWVVGDYEPKHVSNSVVSKPVYHDGEHDTDGPRWEYLIRIDNRPSDWRALAIDVIYNINLTRPPWKNDMIYPWFEVLHHETTVDRPVRRSRSEFGCDNGFKGALMRSQPHEDCYTTCEVQLTTCTEGGKRYHIVHSTDLPNHSRRRPLWPKAAQAQTHELTFNFQPRSKFVTIGKTKSDEALWRALFLPSVATSLKLASTILAWIFAPAHRRCCIRIR